MLFFKFLVHLQIEVVFSMDRISRMLIPYGRILAVSTLNPADEN
jgi:hypothetical protein